MEKLTEKQIERLNKISVMITYDEKRERTIEPEYSFKEKLHNLFRKDKIVKEPEIRNSVDHPMRYIGLGTLINTTITQLEKSKSEE